MDKIIIPEEIHAYTYLGEPVEYVPMKIPVKEGVCPECKVFISTTNKNKCPICKAPKIDMSNFEVRSMTKVTSKHLKQYGLFPSISRMVKFNEMPFELIQWSVNRHVQLTMDLYDPDRAKWIDAFNLEYPKLSEEFTAPGKFVHMLLNKYLKDEPYEWATLPTKIQIMLEHVRNWYLERGITDPVCERAYCAPELNIAGTIDIHSGNIVDDFKTKHTDNSWAQIKKRNKQALDDIAIQIGGYVSILDTKDIFTNEYHCVAICANPEHEDYGKYEFIKLEHEHVNWGKEVILANTQAWCKRNRYYPYQMYKQDKCWTLDEILKGKRNAGEDQTA